MWTVESGYFLIRWRRKIGASVYLANWNTAADRKQRASVLLEVISSLLACMQQNVAVLNAEISYARRRLDICKLFTLSTGQNGRQKQLKRVGKQCRPRRLWVRPGRTSAQWDNFVNPQWIRSESEYVWPGEFDLNTLWSHNVWTRIFSYPERKKLRIKKYLDKCGRSLRGIGFYWHKSTTRKKLGMSDWLKTGSPVKQWIDIWALRPFEEASFTGTYRHIALYLESVKKSI